MKPINYTKEDNYPEKRYCDQCGKVMTEGYLVHDTEYYCCKGCLNEQYSETAFNEMFDDNEAFWTEWENESRTAPEIKTSGIDMRAYCDTILDKHCDIAERVLAAKNLHELLEDEEKANEEAAEVMANNLMICEFMEMEIEEASDGKMAWPMTDRDGNTAFYYPNELKFHTSWDWLHLVIMNCYSLDDQASMDKWQCLTCDDESFVGALLIDNIKLAYEIVVKFITWRVEYTKSE